ncbi:unnamed protein product, partial [Brassica oleracea var. botrytis]
MGCPNSKLGSDDDEPVKICKDKKRFIKQALLEPSGSRRVQVQETSPDETYNAETYGADSFLGTCCPNIQPPSPHNSQWDFFWNQFAQLDYNGYNHHHNMKASED